VNAPPITIIEACADAALFARWFRKPDTWRAWFVFLRTLFGVPIATGDRDPFMSDVGRGPRVARRAAVAP
jgi:hypothetical protein